MAATSNGDFSSDGPPGLRQRRNIENNVITTDQGKKIDQLLDKHDRQVVNTRDVQVNFTDRTGMSLEDRWV